MEEAGSNTKSDWSPVKLVPVESSDMITLKHCSYSKRAKLQDGMRTDRDRDIAATKVKQTQGESSEVIFSRQ